MIICHCNHLTRDELNGAIDQLLAFDPAKHVKPSVVHGQLGCESKCCGCYPELKRMISDRVELKKRNEPALV